MDEILYCCSFPDFSENAETVPELLSAMDYEFSSWRDAETGKRTHTLYFKTAEEAADAGARIRSLRDVWRGMEVEIGDPVLADLKKEDWAESWKIHFKPIEISPRLAITPSWIEYPSAPGRHVITLDPGMSFGTGQHATTKFCLTQLDLFAARQDVSALSMLDAGCGSGILAIAAEKLGFREICAFDIDPDATRIAAENAGINGCSRIRFATASLIEYNAEGKTFDVIAANILSSALLAGKEKLLSLLKPGGCLILAGILDREYPLVREAFEQSGCCQFASTEENKWRGGAFLRENGI